MEVTINYLAVLVASVVGFGIGAVWYSMLFQKPWMKLMGLTPESMRAMPLSAQSAMIFGFIATLLTAYVLAHFIELVDANTVPLALQTGFWAWLGFVAMTQLGSFLWEGKSIQLVFINAGQTLVSMLAMSAILAGWQ